MLKKPGFAMFKHEGFWEKLFLYQDEEYTGHSLKQVTAILDAHYLNRDSALGVSAIRMLEAYEMGTKIPK